MALFQCSTVKIQAVFAGRPRKKRGKMIIFQYTKQAGTELETRSTCPVLAYRGAWHCTHIEQLWYVPKWCPWRPEDVLPLETWNLSLSSARSISPGAGRFAGRLPGVSADAFPKWDYIYLPSVQQHVGFLTTDLELNLSLWIAWKYRRFAKMYSSYPETWIWVIDSD